MSKKCANCGAVIDDNAKVCPECNAELIERPNTIGMPISYELACREAEKGVKWAKFLAYGFFLFSGILSLVVVAFFINQGVADEYSLLFLLEGIFCVVYAVTCFLASYSIIKRKKHTKIMVVTPVIVLAVMFLVLYTITGGLAGLIIALVGCTIVCLFVIYLNIEYFTDRNDIYICKNSNEIFTGEDMVKEDEPKEQRKVVKIKAVPGMYDIAFKEVQLGTKWADFLAYFVFTMGGLLEIWPGFLMWMDIGRDSGLFMYLTAFIHPIICFWAAHEITLRKQTAKIATHIAFLSAGFLGFLKMYVSVVYSSDYIFVNDDDALLWPYLIFAFAIVVFVCLNDGYFKMRNEIFANPAN